MPKLSALIWDLDGTLLDTHAGLCAALSAASEEMVGEVVTQELLDEKGLAGGGLDEICDALVLPHTTDPAALVRSRFASLFLSSISSQPPSPCFDDASPGLSSLSSWPGFPSLLFAIATTKPTATAEADLRARSVPGHLRGYFHAVQGTDGGMRTKPAPDVVLAAARKLGVDVKESVYIGDTPRDMRAAKAAGCICGILVDRAGKAERGEADYVVRSLREVRGVLAGRLGVPEEGEFEAADEWGGRREGMVFMTGKRGLGYYSDWRTVAEWTGPAGGRKGKGGGAGGPLLMVVAILAVWAAFAWAFYRASKEQEL
jgi:phosphoglycolate phosphatase